MNLLKIASRKSALARLQSYLVAQKIQSVDPSLKIQFRFSESLGDKNLDQPLWKIPEKGLFTQDLLQDLLANKCDLVVHSWKDLPLEQHPETEIVATLDRADSRDLLLMKKNAQGPELRILSSSPRRAYNLERLLPELLPFKVERITFDSIRGNVPTRIRKFLADPNAQGFVLAKAGLDRLLNPPTGYDEDLLSTAAELKELLQNFKVMVLPTRQNPCAAAQGALAIEIRKDRSDLKKLLSQINNERVYADVQLERKILSSYGGGCHQKIGVHVQRLNEAPQMQVVSLQGQADSGEILSRWEILTEPKSQRPASASKLWPQDLAQASSIFERHPLDFTIPREKNALFVAKSSALPEGIDLEGRVLWVAGHESWKKLAQRGFWVHGSSESLGEKIPELPYFEQPLNWLKLTHQGANFEDSADILATYKLIDRKTLSFDDLNNKSHFFWTSYSLFEAALAMKSDLMDPRYHHACGPGNTFKLLKRRLGANPEIVLSFDDWFTKYSS